MQQMWLVGILAATLSMGSASAQEVPAGEQALGTISLPRSVMADGKPLAAGSYQVRLTGQSAQPTVAGQRGDLNRWVEFVRGGEVRGREVVTVIPAAEMKDLNSSGRGPRPGASGTRVEMLKGDDYLRVWINRGGVAYLIHMPPA
ncbi:MAG: hypothetical protein Q8L86_05820 [Vicinamibacterales bacterium]|nr:hypothetical protein [Vicinamibacterales bacterium]